MTIKVLGYTDERTRYPYEHKPGYEFVVEGDDYDWLVVYEELVEPVELKCDPRKTIFATWEPVSIKRYSSVFTRQFAHFLSNRPKRAENHPGYHLGRGYFAWFLGRSYAEAATTALPPKTRMISVACSSKQMRHTQHWARYRLVKSLQRLVPGLEWFGHGVRGFERKCEVLDAYKYHVAVENHIANHHWTEKITDAFLAECLPFYAGAPDLAEDFPRESFIPIPLHDPVAAAEIINRAMADNEYEKRLPAIREAKRLVLEKYNFWQQVIDVVEEAESASRSPSFRQLRKGMVFPRKVVRRMSVRAALEDGVWHASQYLKGAFRIGASVFAGNSRS